MATEGPTQAELDQAKTYLIGAYPLRFDGNDAIARIMVGMQLDGLTPDYIKTRNDKVEAVTIDDVKRVAGDRVSSLSHAMKKPLRPAARARSLQIASAPVRPPKLLW